MATKTIGHDGHMTRGQVRQRVNASIVPGQERQKHVIFLKNGSDSENRRWIWNYGCNYKGATVLLCIIGVVICVYALTVEYNKEANPHYEAMCDINEAMSCSKVLTSKWGKGFGILGYLIGDEHPLNARNPYLGIVFYILQLILSDLKGRRAYKIQLGTSILANLGTIYLAYILYFVLEDICLVCISTYITNFLLLLANVSRYNAMRRMEISKKQ